MIELYTDDEKEFFELTTFVTRLYKSMETKNVNEKKEIDDYVK